MGAGTRTDAERFELMEQAIVMRTQGVSGVKIMKAIGIGHTTYERWKQSKDWRDIEGDVLLVRRKQSADFWRTKLHTAGKMLEKLAAEGDVNGASYIEAIRYVVDSQELGPKGDDNEESSSSTPVTIQINTAERAALSEDLRNTLGGTGADGLDIAEGSASIPRALDSGGDEG